MEEQQLVTDAFILAGGFGTRLRDAVPFTPKPLAQVNGRPFITFLLDQLKDAGIEKVVIGTGYQSELFPEELGHEYKGMSLIFSKESEPLGTGGSVKHGSSFISGSKFLVLNGDSFLNFKIRKFIEWDEKHDLAGSVLLTKKQKENRYGNIVLENDKIVSFDEKGSESEFINAGYYILSKHLFNDFPHPAFSIEKDCFPFWVDDGIGGWYSRGKFIDIGTPESYTQAQKYFKDK